MSVGSGVTFPSVDGRRSSSASGRAVLAAAARPLDDALADRVLSTEDWRRDYVGRVRDVVVASFADADDAVRSARAGLDAVQAHVAVAGGGIDVPLGQHVLGDPPVVPASVTVQGREPRTRELVVPYRGERLAGDALRRQLDDWQDRGVLEPSHADAVRLVADHPEWLDLGDWTFALLGAGAEMAPRQPLLDWGATVYAVDRPDPSLWRRVGAGARGSAGRLVAPVPHGDDVERAGLDLLTELPQARAWLERAPGRLVIGNYAYADGSAFFRLAAGIDALTAAVLGARDDAVPAVLATPTDVYAAPVEAVRESQRRWEDRGARRHAQAPARAFSGGRLFQPSYPELVRLAGVGEVGVADCLVPQQGPNYALAKALQRWRATVSHADGRLVSANVAPPTRTRSVVRNRVLAAAYAGAPRFGVEVFAPPAASALMAALLVHDLRTGRPDLRHPQELFSRGAHHGGLWRVAYDPRSVLGFAVALGMLRRGGS